MSGPGDGCWARIGVAGDRSCVELEARVHCRNCPVYEAAGRALLDREPPPGYLAEWAAALAADPCAERSRRDAVLVIRIGREWLGFPAALVAEVAVPGPLRRLPRRTGRILLGLVNVRGEILPCVSLAEVLGVSRASEDGAAPRLVVVRRDRQGWAFPVEEVDGVHRFHEADLEALPATAAIATPRFARRVLPVGDRRVGLLDVEALFPALERGLA